MVYELDFDIGYIFGPQIGPQNCHLGDFFATLLRVDRSGSRAGIFQEQFIRIVLVVLSERRAICPEAGIHPSHLFHRFCDPRLLFLSSCVNGEYSLLCSTF